MILIAAIDNGNGLLFNHRRQSRDRVLREKILGLTSGGRLWMNAYSAGQFQGYDAPQLRVSEDFLSLAAPGEFCLVEDVSAAPYEQAVEGLILFKWNRRYPGDFFFDLDCRAPVWRLERTEDFAGSSHEKITMEVYRRA